jgi:hypothetical protein
MKTAKIFLFIALFAAGTARAQVQNRVTIPDIDGYRTLQCDFHIHSVFSDGLVWPTVRIDEAWREGLDAISLTEHLEYRPHSEDIVAAHDRSYDIAEPGAERQDILLIRGSEITRPMAPGHFNAIFLDDSDPLAQSGWRDAFAAARAQNAFIFWNHPAWDSQQPDTTRWFAEHTEIFDNGWMHGIEVANGRMYSEDAFRWCLDKNLTMIGTSDIHRPIQTDIDFARGAHRTMTLVFARERTPESIREALDNRRTAVYFDDTLIGQAQYLRSIFENAIEITDIRRTDTGISVTLKNNSGLTFQLEKTAHDPEIVYFRTCEIRPHSRHTLSFRFPAGKRGEINFRINNLLVRPGEGLAVSCPLP